MEGKRRARSIGRTRINKLVFVEAQAELRGDLVQVKFEHTGPWSLRGSQRLAGQSLHQPALVPLAAPIHPIPEGAVP